MPLDKSGKFHINPQMARMHDGSDHAPDDAAEPPKKKFEASKNDDGSFHSVKQHEDGQTEEADHQDIEELKQALHDHLSDDSDEDADVDQDEQDQDSQPDYRAARTDSGAY